MMCDAEGIARKTDPTPATVKRLFALSCNVCAYRGCEERLADPNWKSVQADLAHIRGEKPGAARYDSNQSDEDRRSFENIILLCPNHHRRIDLLEPYSHSVDLLEEMKEQHERACAGADWASDEDLQRYMLLLLSREPSTPPATGAPRLRVEKGPGQSYEIVNVGDADAYDPTLLLEDDETRNAVIFTGEAPSQLSSGARWRAFLHAQTLGNAGPHMVKLVWTAEDGQTYNGHFPIG
jgi:hypothetical protein